MSFKLATLAAASALALLPVAAGAATATYSFNLSGSQEVPPVNTPAAGSMQITIDDVANLISFSFAAFNLQGAFQMAHIHVGPVGANGQVVYDFGPNIDAAGPVMIGSFSIPNSWSFVGTNKAIGASLADAINAQPWNYYVNIHTSFSPSGEIRGQLAPIPEPGTWALMALGLGAVGFIARRRAQRG